VLMLLVSMLLVVLGKVRAFVINTGTKVLECLAEGPMEHASY
jgi:hypothetical protein